MKTLHRLPVLLTALLFPLLVGAQAPAVADAPFASGAPVDPVEIARGELIEEAELLWSSVYPLTREGGSDAELALFKYIARYEAAAVLVSGESFRVNIPHMEEARTMLKQLEPENQRDLKVGLYLGTGLGAQLEWGLSAPSVEAMGLKLGLVAPLFDMTGGVTHGPATELYLDFPLARRWQLEVGLGGGLAAFHDPFVTSGVAARYVSSGPFHLTFGLNGGLRSSDSDMLLLPVLETGWLW